MACAPRTMQLSKGGAVRRHEMLADSEIKISFAVLGYARDARGGRITPQRVSPNLDPVLALPNPMEVIESIAFRSDPAAYLRSFQPDQPQFEALRKALIAARGGDPDTRMWCGSPTARRFKLGVDDEQVALLRKRLDIPVEDRGTETMFDASVHAAVQRFQESRGVLPDGHVGRAQARCSTSASRQATTPETRLILLNIDAGAGSPRPRGVLRRRRRPRVHGAGDGRRRARHTARRAGGNRTSNTGHRRRDIRGPCSIPVEHAELNQDRGDQALLPRGGPLVRRRRLEHCRS